MTPREAQLSQLLDTGKELQEACLEMGITVRHGLYVRMKVTEKRLSQAKFDTTEEPTVEPEDFPGSLRKAHGRSLGKFIG